MIHGNRLGPVKGDPGGARVEMAPRPIRADLLIASAVEVHAKTKRMWNGGWSRCVEGTLGAVAKVRAKVRAKGRSAAGGERLAPVMVMTCRRSM